MRLRDDNAVAAGCFATIESLVCASHNGVEGRIRTDKLSDSCGEGHLDVAGGEGDGGRGQTVAKLFGDVDGSPDVSFREDDSKFFATQTSDEVRPPKSGAEQVGNGAKSHISSIVAVTIVDGLEVVDIDGNHGDGPGGTAGQSDLALRLAHDGTTVEDASKGIGEGGFAKILVRLDHEKPDVEQDHRESDEHDGKLGRKQAGIDHRVIQSPGPVPEDDPGTIECKANLRQKGDRSDARGGTEALLAVSQEQPYAEHAEDDPGRKNRDDEVPRPDETERDVYDEANSKHEPAMPLPRGLPANKPAEAEIHGEVGEDADLVRDEGGSPEGENAEQPLEHGRNGLQTYGGGKPGDSRHSPVFNGES
jgi:hypothetical protein